MVLATCRVDGRQSYLGRRGILLRNVPVRQVKTRLLSSSAVDRCALCTRTIPRCGISLPTRQPEVSPCPPTLDMSGGNSTLRAGRNELRREPDRPQGGYVVCRPRRSPPKNLHTGSPPLRQRMKSPRPRPESAASQFIQWTRLSKTKYSPTVSSYQGPAGIDPLCAVHLQRLNSEGCNNGEPMPCGRSQAVQGQTVGGMTKFQVARGTRRDVWLQGQLNLRRLVNDCQWFRINLEQETCHRNQDRSALCVV